METSEISRIELRAQILKEDERKETIKIKSFEKAILEARSSLENDKNKIINARELLVKKNSINDKTDISQKFLEVKNGIVKLQKLKKLLKCKENEICKLVGEKTKVSDSLIKVVKIKERLQEIAYESREIIKSKNESSSLEESASQKFILSKESENNLRDVIQINQESFLDASRTEVAPSRIVIQNTLQNGSESFANPHHAPKDESQKRYVNSDSARTFEELKKAVSQVEAWQTSSGSGVRMSVSSGSGAPMQFDISEVGNKNVSIKVTVENSNDQRTLWGKKKDILKALIESGYKISNLSISGGVGEPTK